jgi:peptidoglycan-associated lipoprotein
MKTYSPAPRLFALAVAGVVITLTGCHHDHTVSAPTGPMTDGGIATNSAPVAPTVTQFTADPLAINLGDPVVLNWRTANADSVTIDGIGAVAPSGTQTVMPSNSTSFHLTAKGPGGSSEANVRVTVHAPAEPVVSSSSTDGGSVTDSAFHAAVQDALFDYDSFDLRPDARQAAAGAAAYLASHPDVKVLVAGYCDERGSVEYNLALGENRANAAKSALVNAGVASTRIRVVSYGKEKQMCTESTEACWQQNRRAQFSVDR